MAEPAPVWHEELKKNRSAKIDFDCVWSKSGETLVFNVTEEAELSTIDQFSDRDGHAKRRATGTEVVVTSISLIDLLKKHNAPKNIDYLSIDTEGSEFEILKNFDFSKHQFRVITCEHNFTPMREKIFALLSKNGYVRKFEELSKFDDWYIKA